MMIVMMMTYLNWKIAKLFWGDIIWDVVKKKQQQQQQKEFWSRLTSRRNLYHQKHKSCSWLPT